MADVLLDAKLDQVLVTARTLTQLFTFFHLAVELLWGRCISWQLPNCIASEKICLMSRVDLLCSCVMFRNILITKWMHVTKCQSAGSNNGHH